VLSTGLIRPDLLGMSLLDAALDVDVHVWGRIWGMIWCVAVH
jgi:hypothetical protein